MGFIFLPSLLFHCVLSFFSKRLYFECNLSSIMLYTFSLPKCKSRDSVFLYTRGMLLSYSFFLIDSKYCSTLVAGYSVDLARLFLILCLSRPSFLKSFWLLLKVVGFLSNHGSFGSWNLFNSGSNSLIYRKPSFHLALSWNKLSADWTRLNLCIFSSHSLSIFSVSICFLDL